MPWRCRAGVLLSAALGLLMMMLVGCSDRMRPEAPLPTAVRQAQQQGVTDDGVRLPLHHWAADGEAQAIVLGLHGFNEYGGTFKILADALTPQGITVYAYDQRGFGATAQRGLWPGHARLADDATQVAERLRERHPETALYLTGHSMGGAVAILAAAGDAPPPVNGSVLIAPAVWGIEAMPWYQRLGLWLGVHVFPSLRLPASIVDRLGIAPTDDAAIERQLAKDPLILHHSRIDTLHGVSQAMDASLAAARRLPPPALILYGENDQLIPPRAICALLARLPDHSAMRLALYPQGYHMLTRDTRRARTLADIAAWLGDTSAPLPSGQEVDRRQARQALCAPSPTQR